MEFRHVIGVSGRTIHPSGMLEEDWDTSSGDDRSESESVCTDKGCAIGRVNELNLLVTVAHEGEGDVVAQHCCRKGSVLIPRGQVLVVHRLDFHCEKGYAVRRGTGSVSEYGVLR